VSSTTCTDAAVQQGVSYPITGSLNDPVLSIITADSWTFESISQLLEKNPCLQATQLKGAALEIFSSLFRQKEELLTNMVDGVVPQKRGCCVLEIVNGSRIRLMGRSMCLEITSYQSELLAIKALKVAARIGVLTCLGAGIYFSWPPITKAVAWLKKRWK